MDVRIGASTVAGDLRAPPSKSYTHRAVLAAGYGPGARVVDPLDGADTRATARVVEAFGGTVDRRGDVWRVEGFDGRPAVPDRVIECDNSGTTMRLATAAAALAPGTTVLTGDRSLRARPQGPLLSAIARLGGRAESTRSNGQAPLVVAGPVDGGRVAVPGDVSSQFVTALLMAGAVTDEGLEVAVTTPLKSAPYVAITLSVLSAFGVDARRTDEGFAVDGGGYGRPRQGDGARGHDATRDRDRDGGRAGDDRDDGGRDDDGRSDDGEGASRNAGDPGTYRVPGDYSSASYLLAAGAVAGPEGVTVRNLPVDPQGDAAVVDVLDRMGAAVTDRRGRGSTDPNDSSVTVAGGDLSGVAVDVGDTPDLLPTVAAVGAVADGDTRIENCGHVRLKETDRVAAMAAELDRMGVRTTEREAELVVHGGDSTPTGATVDARGDHRLAMALSVLGLAAGETTVRGADCVEVSYPDFFADLERLGASVDRRPDAVDRPGSP